MKWLWVSMRPRAKKHRRYRTIPRESEEAILDLADGYPNLGQDGLQEKVEKLGVNADHHELKLFLREHGKGPEIPEPGFHDTRTFMDVGWPTWASRTPVGKMDWPEGEPFEHRFPQAAWMFRQPLWFRVFAALPILAGLGVVAVMLIACTVRAVGRLLGWS